MEFVNVSMATEFQSKPPIPVVRHVISDDRMGLKQGICIQPINYSKVIKLLTDQHSINLFERHTHSLQRLVRHHQEGFLIKDLVQVFKILNVCADRIQDNAQYIESMCDILTICSKPFLKEKSSDEMAYSQIVVESISQLGYLMRVPSKEVRLQLAKTLLSIYSRTQEKSEVQDHQPTSTKYSMLMVERSDVAETLVKSLALLEEDIEVKLIILDVIQHLSAFSAANCNRMLAAEAASRVCSRMNDQDSTGRLLFISIEILWNLLENGEENEVAKQLHSYVCINALKEAFLQQMTSGFSHYARQIRNDLLVISTLVATKCPEAPYIETGYAKQLILFATFQEVRSHNALVRHLKLSTNTEDLELKKLLINILVVLSKETAFIPLLTEGRVILALFSYVTANENVSQPRKWSPAQYEEIQLHAMSVLCTLAPLCVEDYMTCQGNTRLLLQLEWCVGKENFAGRGNAFHGSGGCGNKRAQMRYCLRMMRSMLALGNEAVNQDLVDQGAINQLLDILWSASYSETADDFTDVEMQCDMLFILSVVCEDDMHRKELFYEKGVKVLLQYLHTNPDKLDKGLGHHRLILATVDCIWSCVVGAYLNEDTFLEGQGLFSLLDLLESSAKNMHNLLLGCLLDLCENPKTISHVMAWRGKADCTAANLLVHIWREEESIIAVGRDEHGRITDTSKPLMGALQEQAGVTSLPANCPSQAIVDVSENMRAKIYAILCKIGFVDVPGLSAQDHVSLCLIERYLDFKQGEVWKEIHAELQQESVRPVTPDQETLATIECATAEIASRVVATQTDLLEAKEQQDLLYEQQLYADIRDNHRQKEKAIQKWEGYVARTSNYNVLKFEGADTVVTLGTRGHQDRRQDGFKGRATLQKQSKASQDKAIEISRIQTDYLTTDTFHGTELSHLQTTTYQGRHITVDSTPLELTSSPILAHKGQDKDRGVTLRERSAVFIPSEA